MARSARPVDRYRARRRGRGLPIWLSVLGILALLGTAGATVWFVLRQMRSDAVDAATLCPLDGATGLTAILLDMTDPLGATQALALRAKLDALVLGSPRGTLVALGRVSDRPQDLGATFALCRPMTGREGGDAVRNSAQLDRRFQAGFLQPFHAQIAALLDAEPAKASPIMEGLQAMLSGVAALPLAEGAPRRVTIVSDLLQHSDAMSFYRGEDWGAFQASPQFARLARNLDGVAVSVLRVPRPGAKVDPGAVDDFWVRYLEAQGAASVDVASLGDL